MAEEDYPVRDGAGNIILDQEPHGPLGGYAQAIGVDATNFDELTGTDLQTVLEEIDAALAAGVGGGGSSFLDPFIFQDGTNGVSDDGPAMQTQMDDNDGILLLPAGTYLVNTPLVKGTNSQFVLRALGNGPVIIKTSINIKTIFIDNSGAASAPAAITGLTKVTDNTQDYVAQIVTAALPAGADRNKYVAVTSSNLHLGEKTFQIASIVKTTSTTVTVTTRRPHGLTAGAGKVLIAYAAGMTEINSLTPYTINSVTSTTMVLATTDNTAWGAYTANSGYAVAETDYGFLGEGSQIMEIASGTTMRLHGTLKQQTRFTDNLEVRVLDETFKVQIEGIEFQPNGNSFGSTNRTTFDCVELIACVGARLRDLTFKNQWSMALRLRTCMNCDIDNVNFEGGMNKLSVVAFGYGLAMYGMNYAHKIGRVNIKQLRHGITCGTSQGAAYDSDDWYNMGQTRKVEMNDLTAYNSHGTIFDTHEPIADLHIKHATLIGGFNGPEDESSVGGAYSCRGIDETIDHLFIMGCRTGVYVQVTDHGVPNTLTIGTLHMQGHEQADDSDVCLRTYDADGVSYPVNVRVQNMMVKDVGRAILKGKGTSMEIGNITTVGVDIVALVYPGGSLVIWGNQFYDFRENPFNTPNHFCFLMYSDATLGGAVCRLLTSPVIAKGANGRPQELFTEQDTTANKSYYLPRSGFYEINDGAFTPTLLLESGATTLVKDANVQQLYNAKPIMRHAVHSAGNASLTLTDMAAADTLIGSSKNKTITKMDLADFTECRIVAQVAIAGTAGSKVKAMYATSHTTTEANYLDLGTSEISTLLTATGTIVSNWIPLAAGAKAAAGIWFGMIGTGGNGADDPAFHNLYVEFR